MTDERRPIRFDGQIVLVSGAGRGIGRSHALLFADRGAHVVVNDVDREVAERVATEITRAGGAASAAPGDVLDDADEIVHRALDVAGRLDALVNNAGIALDSPFGAAAVHASPCEVVAFLDGEFLARHARS